MLIRRALLLPFAVVLLLLATSISLQALRGAYASSFGTTPDEPAHYVTGLLVRDYIARGFMQHPVRFAENYYIHYPRVALGQWPPAFYVIQAAWTLPFGASRGSVITLMAALSALLAALLYFATSRAQGVPIAAASALLLLGLPIVQEHSGAILAEIPLALLCFAAIYVFGRFLDTGATRHCVLFGVFSIAAIFTKGDGLALALVPPVALLITRRWSLLRRPALWLTGAAVGLTTAPWYLLTLDRISETWVGTSGSALQYLQEATPFYFATLFGMGGFIVGAVALFGLFATLFSPARSNIGVAAIGLLAGAITVHGLIPSSTEERHMVMVAPALMLFFAIGLDLLLTRFRRASDKATSVGIAVGALILTASFIAQTPQKAWSGFDEAAKQITSDASLGSRAILVSSESVVDGILIAESAMHDDRPSRIILRADRILSHSGWLGQNYVLRYDSHESIHRMLDAVPVALAVVDTSIPERHRRPHHELLRAALSQAATEWILVDSIDVMRDGVLYERGLELYRRAGDVPPALVKFENVFGESPRPFAHAEGT